MAQLGLQGDLGYAYRHFLHEHGSADDIAQHEGFHRWVFELDYIESQEHLLEAFGPHGTMAPQRKALSHVGVIRGPAGEYDPGNWVYAVVARSLVLGLRPGHPLEHYDHHKDELLGDLFEAILGLAIRVRDGSANTTISRAVLERYVNIIEQCCWCVEKIWAHVQRAGWWLDSRTTTAALRPIWFDVAFVLQTQTWAATPRNLGTTT